MHIGVFGGSFNPPHVGHLIVLESVQEQLQFDKVLFIPAAIPPHKVEQQLAPPIARFEMTSMAVKNHPVFRATDIEIRREGYSYTIDTILQLQVLYPQAKISLIIGADNFLELDTWKSLDSLLQLVELVVMNRPDYSAASHNSPYFRSAKFVSVPNIAISSSEIRRRVKQHRSIRYLVPTDVEQYIYLKGLYRE